MLPFQFLRPYLCRDLPPAAKSAYVCFSTSTSNYKKSKGDGRTGRRIVGRKSSVKLGKPIEDGVVFRGAVGERIEELKKANALEWPRIKADPHTLTVKEFREKYESQLKPGEMRIKDSVKVSGRLRAFRIAGKALIFMDIAQDEWTTQVVCNIKKIVALGGEPTTAFKDFYHLIQRGDYISAYGTPYSTQTGELSVSTLELPEILSPSLALPPKVLQDRETRIRNRHVDILVNSSTSNTLRARSHIIQHIRNFLLEDNFLEVQTPIIADKAGGAIARPFTTVATEFSEKQLALRVAPELWLKRLVIGGMDRVFEIGPAFRNEGLDATHNPEFTTCEFYKAFAELEELISMTEQLLAGVAKMITDLRLSLYRGLSIPLPDPELFAAPFKRIEFIPAIEEGLEEKLPDLAVPDAEEKIVELFQKHALHLPTSTTLPRLLDKLSSLYIEPHCTAPTFITHHPACMSPLAKSFLCKKTSQLVSARAELFINSKEIANMYEEENSPFSQREKFMEQQKWKDGENEGLLDESYLEALEWGLPPTGGWGCGVDRLVMLFTGASRISDVLSFGSLRNVVNLGTPSSVKEKEIEKVKDGKVKVDKEEEDDARYPKPPNRGKDWVLLYEGDSKQAVEDRERRYRQMEERDAIMRKAFPNRSEEETKD